MSSPADAGFGDEAMPDATTRLIRGLAARNLTIAVAESLTGGALTAELTRPPGASAVVVGGIVVYATALKHSLAGVDAVLLDERGPVDPDVAAQLANGARERVAVAPAMTSIGVGVTGVAGPEPQGRRPVGCVFVGISHAGGTEVIELSLTGDRETIRRLVVEHVVVALAERFLGS